MDSWMAGGFSGEEGLFCQVWSLPLKARGSTGDLETSQKIWRHPGEVSLEDWRFLESWTFFLEGWYISVGQETSP